MRLKLEQQIRFAGVDLKPGMYRLTVTERPDGRAEICVFRRNLRHAYTLAAVAGVDIVAGAEAEALAVVEQGAAGMSVISEITTGKRTFRLRPAPVGRTRREYRCAAGHSAG